MDGLVIAGHQSKQHAKSKKRYCALALDTMTWRPRYGVLSVRDKNVAIGHRHPLNPCWTMKLFWRTRRECYLEVRHVVGLQQRMPVVSLAKSMAR